MKQSARGMRTLTTRCCCSPYAPTWLGWHRSLEESLLELGSLFQTAPGRLPGMVVYHSLPSKQETMRLQRILHFASGITSTAEVAYGRGHRYTVPPTNCKVLAPRCVCVYADLRVDAETSLSLSLHLYLSSPPLHFFLTLTFGL